MSTLGLDEHILPSDLIGAALRGPHRRLALGGDGPAVRYDPEISNFASLRGVEDSDVWAALSALAGDQAWLLRQTAGTPTPGWTALREIPVVALSGRDVELPAPEVDVLPLGAADVPEMLDLTARTAPGPFLPRTIEFGGYVGVRRDGVLAAMAGRRLSPPGWVEISAVCTDPAFRGQGLARQLISAVVCGIRADGGQPFLHTAPSNPALGLYASLGFRVVRESVITVLGR